MSNPDISGPVVVVGVVITAPALISAGVGVAHYRVAESIERCQQGQEVAVCPRHAAADEQELHREEVILPRKPEQDPFLPPTSMQVHWDRYVDDETMAVVQETLRRQRNFVAPFHAQRVAATGFALASAANARSHL
jgi:hypothetical protein